MSDGRILYHLQGQLVRQRGEVRFRVPIDGGDPVLVADDLEMHVVGPDGEATMHVHLAAGVPALPMGVDVDDCRVTVYFNVEWGDPPALPAPQPVIEATVSDRACLNCGHLQSWHDLPDTACTVKDGEAWCPCPAFTA